jgi:hypothetical protein
LLQKTPHYRGFGKITATLNAKLCDLAVVVVVTGGILPLFSPNLLSTRKLKDDEGRAASQVE